MKRQHLRHRPWHDLANNAYTIPMSQGESCWIDTLMVLTVLTSSTVSYVIEWHRLYALYRYSDQ